MVWSIAESKLVDVATSPAEKYRAVFSPDGKWLAYQSDESGREEIYVQPFPPTGAPDLDRRLTVAAVETTPMFRTGAPKTLFDIERSNGCKSPAYDVLPDGNLIVNGKPASRQPPR